MARKIHNKQAMEAELHRLQRELAHLAPYPVFATANNNFALGQSNVVRGAFNAYAAQGHAAMRAYLADLPRRKGLETWIAYYQRKLYALNKSASLRLAV